MKSTREWIDAVKQRHGLTSDYQLAQRWQVTRQLISAYRSGREYLSEDTAAKVAADLGIELALVLACVAGERARMPSARDAWRLLAERLGGTAAAVLVALLLAGLDTGDAAAVAYSAGAVLPLCIMLTLPIAIFVIAINHLQHTPPPIH